MVVMKRFSVLPPSSTNSFTRKALNTALITTLVPLVVLSIALLSPHSSETPYVQVCLVAFTTAITAIFTIVEVRNLLKPVEQLAGFVDKYVSTGEITDLPEDYEGDMGTLMRETKSTVIRLDHSTKELAEASKVDVLTGLQNRRFSAQRLQQDLARANRTQTPLTLVAIDLDDFKHLNDKYGTAVGDVCLKYFADLLKYCVREGDWIARWGGDEFLLLLWDADSRHAEAIINRIRLRLATSEMVHEAGLRLTASFGYTTHAPGDLNFELFAKADAALYRAKRLGRNQAVGPAGVSARH